MSLPPPNASDRYQLTTILYKFTIGLWNSVMGSIADRLTALEARNADYQEVIDTGTDAAIEFIQNSVTPQLNQVASNIADLNQEIAEAQDVLDALQTAGVPAENVPVTPTAAFPPGTSVQEALEQLTDVATDLDNEKLDVAARADLATAVAGQSTFNWMDPAGAAALAAAFGLTVSRQVFTSSATFNKEADDVLYFVESWGGGMSGNVFGPSQNPNNGALGGFGGDYNSDWLLASEIAASVNVIVGSGGQAKTTTTYQQTTPGDPGGDSSFAGKVIARGGRPSSPRGPQEWRGGNPLTGSEADASTYTTAYPTIKGGGAGASGQGSNSAWRSPGTSDAGGTGGVGASPVSGAGQAPGGGGASGFYYVASGAGSVTSGAGARGEVRVLRFKRRKQ